MQLFKGATKKPYRGIRAKKQPTFQTAIFETNFTLWPIKLNTKMYVIKFAFHKLYLFGHFFSIKARIKVCI